jgi:hypothetical protein
MNCHDFDQIWNELLDTETMPTDGQGTTVEGESGPRLPSDRELAAREHAAGCPTCGTAQFEYETLRQALRAWRLKARPSSAPSSDLIERILTAALSSADSATGAIGQTGRGRASRRWRIGLPLAMAVAAVLAFVIVPIFWDLKRVDPGSAQRGAMNRTGRASGQVRSASHSSQPAGFHGLSGSLADATAATWDLARSTSEPAARLGRQVLEVASEAQDPAVSRTSAADSGQSLGSGLVSLPTVLRVVPESPPGSVLLQEVGERLSACVRPLSSTARQAFGFLRTPSLEKNENRINQPASKGA